MQFVKTFFQPLIIAIYVIQLRPSDTQLRAVGNARRWILRTNRRINYCGGVSRVTSCPNAADVRLDTPVELNTCEDKQATSYSQHHRSLVFYHLIIFVFAFVYTA